MSSKRRIDKEYVNGRRFSVVSGKQFYNIDTGCLNFTESTPGSKAISVDNRTIYGWTAAHDGVILANITSVLEQAFHRHTAVRADYDKTYSINNELEVRAAQTAYIDDNFDSLVNTLQDSLGTCTFDKSMHDAAAELQFLPHDKRPLREQCILELKGEGSWALPVWTRVINWKLKRGEFAKVNKIGRIIVDIGVAGSLQGAPWAKVAKEYLASKPVLINDRVEYHFCPDPSPDEVIKFMHLVMTPRTDVDMVLVCFSDDAIIGFRTSTGEWKYFNADISSCDASQGPAVFRLLWTAFNCPPDVLEPLLAQVMAPIVIRNPHVRKETIVLKPLEPYLQSGHTLTTLINCLAWYIIAHRFARESHFDPAMLPAITKAVGYYVEFQACAVPEDLQFLKQSPILDDEGIYRAVLNLGVILRATGMCKGDLPGRGDPKTRAQNFQHSLMNGLLKGIFYPPINKLQPPGHIIDVNWNNVSFFANPKFVAERHKYSTDNFYKRYNLTQDEIAEFEHLITLADFGTVMYCPAITKIMQKDYGLGNNFGLEDVLLPSEPYLY